MFCRVTPNKCEFFVVRICRAVSTFSFTSNQGSSHILGYVTTVKFNELTDIVIFICCSFSLFTHYQSLRYWGSQVRLLPGAPVISVTYIILNFNKSSFAPLLCHWVLKTALKLIDLPHFTFLFHTIKIQSYSEYFITKWHKIGTN